MKPVELSREVNLPPTTIHRLITGKSTRPYKSSLKPIADFFSVSVDQLLGESPLLSEKNIISKNAIRYLPFINWEMLSLLRNAQKKHETENENIPFVGNIGAQAFATTMNDSSMEPQFSKNNILIFDPEKKPLDRSYVLVQLDENIFIFRQLLIDADHQFLKPLNPDLNIFKMRLLGKTDKIVAVLVEARQKYSDE
ncbi:MAG: repressor protein C2 [uncultured bacterium]|nr:MAG: repressor protein C2 [uncultured bacterium]